MIKKQLLILFFFSILFLNLKAQPVKIDQKNQMLILPDGNELFTGLYNLKYHGAILVDGKGYPFLVLSGKDCDNCTTPESIFIHNPNDGALDLKKAHKYPYPGMQFNRTDSSLVYSGRAFIGFVNPDTPNGLIYYQTWRLDDGKFHDNVQVIKLSNNKIVVDNIVENIPDIDITLTLKDLKKCKEIGGIQYLTE